LAGDDEERSFFLSQEFSSYVARLPGVSSHAPPAAAPDPGQRGDPLTLGAIVFAAVSGGGALTALVSTIDSYLARDRRTEVEVATPDGRNLRISSQAFNQKELEELLRRSLPMTGECPMRKIAMLVANDTFPEDSSIPPLRFTQNDAESLKEVLGDLETCGFETKIYLNETSQRILIGLERISGELAQDDTLLFYYSGHGRLRGNDLCLVSKDTETSSLAAASIPGRLPARGPQGAHHRR
jgi:hypothetical protein